MSKIPQRKSLAPVLSSATLVNEESKETTSLLAKATKAKSTVVARPVTAKIAAKSDLKIQADDNAPNDDPIGLAMQARLTIGKTQDAVISEADARKNKVQLVKTFKLTWANAKGPDMFDFLKPEPSEKSTEPNTPAKKAPSIVSSKPGDIVSPRPGSMLSPRAGTAPKKLFGV